MKVVVIGGGAIGVASASWLLRDGHDVTIVEAQGIAAGASFGNAGCLNPSSIVPMSLPGNLKKVPGWLTDPLGPLAIRAPYAPRIAPWLIRFLRAGTPERVSAQAAALRDLIHDCLDVYEPLARAAGAAHLIRRDGHLVVYRSRADFEGDAFGWRLRRDNGIDFDVLEDDALQHIEPELAREYRLGVFFSGNGHTTDPSALVRALAEAFLQGGGHLLRARALGFDVAEGRLQAVRTDAGAIPADAAVIAAGAYSGALAKEMGDPVPLDTERGYHAVIADPEIVPRRTILDASGKFIATPMDSGLRLAGTVEFAGLEAKPDWRRARQLLVLARKLFPRLREEYEEERVSVWMGRRPSMPDSLPVIGPSSRTRDVIHAFGHGHLGLMAAARTGHIVADLVAGRAPAIDIAPFRAVRFRGR
ncbi:NAD(P)/FAD-dependent oxidoreductase [Terrihabitans sp. B22-R8]|uniref:NAD(P)/FAD-dependent oxidoreductase n=1 Tax=Terrihabitans sp. B22-R8 TaxID=3425128 RepID=UPI00403C1AB2